MAAPGPTRLEADVLRWLAREFGYGPDAAGLLTSGGSLSQLSAIVTARHARFGDACVPADACGYTSAQAHRSVAKSWRLSGHASATLRDGRPWTSGCGWTRRRWRRPCDATATTAGSPTWWSRRRVRPTPARSIRCPPSPTSAPSTACGCTSTAPTAARSCCAPRDARCSRHRARATRSRSTRTRGCSCRTARASCSCATARRCGARTRTRRTTCRTWAADEGADLRRRPRPRALASLPRPAPVAAPHAARRARVPRGARREAGARADPARRPRALAGAIRDYMNRFSSYISHHPTSLFYETVTFALVGWSLYRQEVHAGLVACVRYFSRKVGGSNPAPVVSSFEILASLAPSNALSHNEYADLELSVERSEEGEDLLTSSYADVKEMKSLTLHT